MTTFKIGQMIVTIEGNKVKTSHPTNAMKNDVSTFEIRNHVVTGETIVVLTDRSINKSQSKSAIAKIKSEILKSVK